LVARYRGNHVDSGGPDFLVDDKTFSGEGQHQPRRNGTLIALRPITVN
jgi:hypothetical protein